MSPEFSEKDYLGKNLTESEEESKNESISEILNSTDSDVLISFYNLSLIKENDELKEKFKKNVFLTIKNDILTRFFCLFFNCFIINVFQ